MTILKVLYPTVICLECGYRYHLILGINLSCPRCGCKEVELSKEHTIESKDKKVDASRRH